MNNATPAYQKLKAVLLLCSIFLLNNLFAQSGQRPFKNVKGYGTASYKGISPGKVMKTWLVAGPIRVTGDSSTIPDMNSQEKFFNSEDRVNIKSGSSLPDILSKNIKWISYTSKTDIIDFDSIFRNADYSSAYAVAEIQTDTPSVAMFAIGSDDAVKIWHNGKLLHKNWIARAIEADNDLVRIPLVKGNNQLLIEVQDVALGWGFTARFLDKKGLTQQLSKAAATGDLDQVAMLIEAGADINFRTEAGQTPLDAARISGREDVVQLLKQKGAILSPVPSAQELIDGSYSFLNNKSNPGIAILVAKDGKVLYKKGFGYADIENKIQVDPLTKFRIGSITKQFIGAAILKLQEQDRLKVTDKVSKYFPDFPRGDEVTIHHLLTHTSGIHSYTNKDSFFVDVLKPVATENLYNYFKNDDYDFSPGVRYQYNNSGYFLLGYIIEKITGESFGKYLKKEFFDPIGMSNTGVHSSDLKLEKEARGYEKTNNGYKRALNWDMSWAAGAGALYSTVEDLYKWNEALFGGKVLKDESLKSAFTPVMLNNGSKPPGTEYGYGWGMGEYRGLASIGHSGGLHGFISQLQRIPKENLTVVMLTNVSPPQVQIDPSKIAEKYLWNKMSGQPSFAEHQEAEKDIEKFAGRYDFSNGVVMTITKEGDGLFAQLSGQPKFPIFPSGKGHFYWKVVDAKMNFVSNAEGQIILGHFEQGSFKIDAPRLKELTIVEVDSAILEKYVGVFEYKKDVLIKITTANGKIYSEPSGEPRYEMLPLSETEFIIKELNARIVFLKNAEGKVDEMQVTFQGEQKKAKRVK